MIRSAAKNHADVLVIVDANDYEEVRAAIRAGGTTISSSGIDLPPKRFRTRRVTTPRLPRICWAQIREFPELLNLQFQKRETMRYGENPHQRAALYVDRGAASIGTVAGARQLQGRELSYNNVADTDAALECVRVFDEPACVIVKHANPCGVAIGDDLHAAYQGAYATDPLRPTAASSRSTGRSMLPPSKRLLANSSSKW